MNKSEMIEWLQMRLLQRNSKKPLTWSSKDTAAISQLLIDVNRLGLREKALIVIEHIALHGDYEDANTASVYKAVHVANGRCLAPHDDWVQWVEEFYADLVARGEHKPNDDGGQMLDAIKRLEALRL